MTKSILVIEDDGSVAGLLEDVLSREGFDVRAEADGEWGLRAFGEHEPDLVIMDVLLPKLQGFQLLEKLRATPGGERVPVIVMSGVFRRNLYERQLIERHQITAYLDKPVDVDALLDVLHDVFSSAYPESRQGQRRLPSNITKVPSRAVASAPEAAAEVPEKGDLHEIPFARLLGMCFRARATGALMLRRATVKKIVYLKEGIPVFVRSNLLTECLGRVMVEERLISQRECEVSLEKKRKEPERRQGEILVSMGSISQHNLQFALELQMQAKLFEIFSWQEGAFLFNRHGDYEGPQVALAMSPTALIHEGALRGMSAERVRRDLVAAAQGPLLPSRDPTFRYQALQLDPRAERLLDLMDGSRSAEGLLDSGVADPSDAAFLVYALVASGLLYAPPPPPAIKLDEGDVEVLKTGEIEIPPEVARTPTVHTYSDEERTPSTVGKALARTLAAGARLSQATAPLPRPAPPPVPPTDVVEDPETEAVEAQPRADAEPTEAVEAQAALDAAPALDTAHAPDTEADGLEADAHVDVDAEAHGDGAHVDADDHVEEEAHVDPEAQVDGAHVDADDHIEEEAHVDADDHVEEAHVDAEAHLNAGAHIDAEASANGPAPFASLRLGATPSGPTPDSSPMASSRLDPDQAEHPADDSTPAQTEEPRPSRLPRASRWGRPPSGEVPAPTAAPSLSPSLREEVRARLEAESSRLSSLRPAPEARSRRRTAAKKGLGLDLEQERTRLEEELVADVAKLEAQDLYARLDLTPGAGADEVERAFEHLSRRLDPERITAGLRSPKLRLLAERRILLLTRAHATLTEPGARGRYHIQLGLTATPPDAPLVRADDAFEAGRRAARHEAWVEARDAFEAAAALDPEEGVYLSHLAWATHAAAPEDPEAREQALDMLRRAAELNPRHEEVYLFAGRIQQRQGRAEAALQAFQRALRCNPDCVEALAAVRELTPPPTKKSGLFSRLSAR